MTSGPSLGPLISILFDNRMVEMVHPIFIRLVMNLRNVDVFLPVIPLPVLLFLFLLSSFLFLLLFPF